MEALQNEIQTVVDLLQKVDGLPACALTCLFCFIVGFVLKRVGSFPNTAIPAVVVLVGMVLYPLLADSKNPMFEDAPRIWTARAIIIGGVYGFVTWLFHNQVVKRFFPTIADDQTKP